MRMWRIDPDLLCREHLLGAHVECHMLARSVELGKTLDGFVDGGLVELHNIKSEHDAIAGEMLRRGYNHKSPLVLDDKFLSKYKNKGCVSRQKSLTDLCERCSECRDRINASRKKEVSV